MQSSPSSRLANPSTQTCTRTNNLAGWLDEPRGNVAIGNNSLDHFIHGCGQGFGNIAVGLDSLQNLSTVSNESMAIGTESFRDNVDGENTGLGAYTGSKNTGTGNTAVGNWALRYNSTGADNTVMGYKALAGTLAETAQTVYGTGSANTAIGRDAMRANLGGSQNTAVGRDAMRTNTTGSANTAIGCESGITLTTGQQVTLIGAESDVIDGTVTHSTAIGAGSVVGTSNAIILGRPPVLTALPQISGPLAQDRVGIGTSAPLASLHVCGIFHNNMPLTVVTAISGGRYDIRIDDSMVFINCVPENFSGNYMVQLPALDSSHNGRMYTIKIIGAGEIFIYAPSQKKLWESNTISTQFMQAFGSQSYTLMYNQSVVEYPDVVYWVVGSS